MVQAIQNKKDMFDIQEQVQGIQEELPQTRLGVTMGRVLMAGPLGFLVACGALYQAEKMPRQVYNQTQKTPTKKQTRDLPKKTNQTVDLTEEIAFNVALELMQRQMN